ncbi:rhodanese-like domain-containing protein [Micrococcales bacterium 31B]|nr:rhodanese-like domain-containing protein [Micrococcales bacterium 31B]
MSVPTIDLEALPHNAVLLDVREDGEWEVGHAPGAQHLPASEIQQRCGEIPDETVYVICLAGGRSQRITQWLNLNGFDAINVSGGMQAWQANGRPLVAEGDGEPYIKM